MHFHFHHLGWIALPLTHFGNPLLLAGLMGLFTLWLAWASGRRALALWLLIGLATVALMAALKIYFSACPSQHWALHSPSGHTGLSTLVYGALAYSAMRGGSRVRQTLIVIGASLLIIGIGLSRYLLQMHSLPEVGLGLAVGSSALLVFCWRYARLPQKPFPLLRALMLAALLVVPLRMLVKPISLEFEVQGMATKLGLAGLMCAPRQN